MKHMEFTVEEVGYMPPSSQMEPGVLYISREFNLCIHLCMCGECGWETVTPLGSNEWELQETNGWVSLTPSIGNFSYPCRSHYCLTLGKVVWFAS
jgi:hypothetical protein